MDAIMKKKPKPKRKEQRMRDHIVVRVPDTLRAALQKAAEADRRKLSDYIRLALEDHLAGRVKGMRR